MNRKLKAIEISEGVNAELDGLAVRIGFVGISAFKEGSGPTKARVVDVAIFHEFGTSSIPARPFMAPVFDEQRAAVRRVIMAEVRRMLHEPGRTGVQVADRVGVRLVGAVQKAITDVRTPRLADSTLEARKRKTGDTNPNPLIDTGQMRQSVTYAITKHGRPVASARGLGNV